MKKLVSIAKTNASLMGGLAAFRPVTNDRPVSDGSKVAELTLQNANLQADVERLFMITEALWTIAKTQCGLKDEQFDQLVTEIEMRDGKANGRRKQEERPDCPACKRKAIGQHKSCLYCGAAIKLDPFKKY